MSIFNNSSDTRPQFEDANGINAVTGVQGNKSQKIIFAALAGLIFVCLMGYVAYKVIFAGSGTKEEKPVDDGSIVTSSRRLSVPSLSDLYADEKKTEPPMPKPAAAQPSSGIIPIKLTEPLPLPAELKLPEVKVPELKSVPEVVKENVLPDPIKTNDEARESKAPVGPTLDERRFAAPLLNSGQPSNLKAQTEPPEGFGEGRDRDKGSKLSGLLTSVETPRARANRMSNRSMLIPKGTFIDCILETKLDTTVPGMTSCIVPRAVWSANGKVLLVERGSKVIGEYKGSVENGLNRIFVLWTQLQTPQGVRIALDSPGTDAQGGSGLAGHVDFHWWKRFGNALLFSLVQDGFDYAIQKQSDSSGGVNYYQNSQDGMSEIIREAMRQSGNIPPTLTKNQGERIGIFVGRDLDFSSVYDLTIK